MRRSTQLVLAISLIAAVAFYRVVATPPRDWVRVAGDANYDIALDRRSVTLVEVARSGQWFEGFEVSYRTDHALPRMHNGKTFDREVVRAIVQCDRLVFKVVCVDMSVGDGRPVVRQRTSDDDLLRQQWRHVERGTTEETAALAACRFGQQAANHVAAVRRK